MRGWFQGCPLLSSILPAVGPNLWECLAKLSYLTPGHLGKNLEQASHHSKPTLYIQRHLQAEAGCDQEDRKYVGWWEADLPLPRLVVFDHHRPARCWGSPTWKVVHNPITFWKGSWLSIKTVSVSSKWVTSPYMMLYADLVDLRKKVARAMPAMRANQVEGSTTRGQHWSPYL